MRAGPTVVYVEVWDIAHDDLRAAFEESRIWWERERAAALKRARQRQTTEPQPEGGEE